MRLLIQHFVMNMCFSFLWVHTPTWELLGRRVGIYFTFGKNSVYFQCGCTVSYLDWQFLKVPVGTWSHQPVVLKVFLILAILGSVKCDHCGFSLHVADDCWWRGVPFFMWTWAVLFVKCLLSKLGCLTWYCWFVGVLPVVEMSRFPQYALCTFSPNLRLPFYISQMVSFEVLNLNKVQIVLFFF